MRYQEVMAALASSAVDVSMIAATTPGGTGGSKGSRSSRSAEPASGRDARPMNG